MNLLPASHNFLQQRHLSATFNPVFTRHFTWSSRQTLRNCWTNGIYDTEFCYGLRNHWRLHSGVLWFPNHVILQCDWCRSCLYSSLTVNSHPLQPDAQDTVKNISISQWSSMPTQIILMKPETSIKNTWRFFLNLNRLFLSSEDESWFVLVRA